MIKAKIIARRRTKDRPWLEADRRRNPEWAERMEKILRRTGTPCSCYICGNRRRHYGEKTIQETKEDERTKEMMDAVVLGIDYASIDQSSVTAYVLYADGTMYTMRGDHLEPSNDGDGAQSWETE